MSDRFDIVRFHLITEENAYMSNWFPCETVIDGIIYSCAEQYMMAQKALLFGDKEIAEKIMLTDDPQEMKDLGKKARKFNGKIWDGYKQLIVYTAVKAKFTQHEDLRKMLLATGDAIPVECAYHDRVWGIGMDMQNPDAEYPDRWQGQNLLGLTIMRVREELRNK